MIRDGHLIYRRAIRSPLLLSRFDRGILNLPRVHLRNRLFAVLTSYLSFLSFVALAIVGAFAPVLAKHFEVILLIDCVAVGVDRITELEPMRKQVEAFSRGANSPTSQPR